MRYQKEAVDVLYAWAQAPRAIATPKNLVPSEPITAPTRPAPDASLAEWREFYVRMAAVIDWQMEVDRWRGGVESRLEGLEAMTGLIASDPLSTRPANAHSRPSKGAANLREATS